MFKTLTNSCSRLLQTVVQDSYKQLFKTLTNSCLRLLQTVVQDSYKLKNRHAEFISSSYCLHSFSVFPIGNTPFVHLVYSSTTHVNGYSFRLDISYGNISFVLRTHRVCKENHSCSRLLQTVPVMLNYFSISYIYVYIHLMFSCENISFVRFHVLTTVHCYRFVFDFLSKVCKPNLEMQTGHRLELPKRSRYYQAAADIDNTPPSGLYSEMRDNYVIFICTFDPFLQW